MSNYNTITLPNGLRIIHASSPTDVAYCGFAVDAGTRDELPQEQVSIRLLMASIACRICFVFMSSLGMCGLWLMDSVVP